MRIPRIYHPQPLLVAAEVILSEDAAAHVGRVLRMQPGQSINLFDGSNFQFTAVLTEVSKKQVKALVQDGQLRNCESPLHIHLGQVISRGEKMEFTIQKSIELGVNVITPLISTRCGVKLDSARLEKKRLQWQKIAIGACEQCGRNVIPEIRPVQTLSEWCTEPEQGLKLNLHPRAQLSINTLPTPISRIRLLIGPEGGLDSDEIRFAAQHQFNDILLGPRVLRTETTALTAITALQLRFGDLG